jgi:peroxiredoxin
MTSDIVNHRIKSALDGLQAERDASWPTDQLDAHVRLRAGLDAAADRTRFVRPGDRVPDVRLAMTDGTTATLVELAADAPIVVLLFRFEGCPACNTALHAYQQSLVPGVVARGSRVVAISPQVADRLSPIVDRHALEITVASCAGSDLLDHWGVGFSPSDSDRETSLQAGHDMGQVLGTGSWELPYPTALIIDRDGIVRFADIHPDWMVRTESAVLLAELDQVLEA